MQLKIWVILVSTSWAVQFKIYRLMIQAAADANAHI